MCDLEVDVAAICTANSYPADHLDACIAKARELEADGLCMVAGRRLTVPQEARRLVRVAAACFDERLPQTQARHSKAV
jgi:oxygen-independent coproporphyrinogen-3 oxidase